MIPLGVMASARAAAVAPGALTYLGGWSSSTSQATYTIPGVSLGPASPRRTILVTFGTRSPSGAVTVTVGGATAVEDVKVEGTSSSQGAHLFRAAVPTGTTGDIVLATQYLTSRQIVHAWAIDATLTLSTTGTAEIDAAAITAPIPAGGVGVAASTAYASSATACAWTGATESGVAVGSGIIYASAAVMTGSPVTADWSVATGPPATVAATYTAA